MMWQIKSMPALAIVAALVGCGGGTFDDQVISSAPVMTLQGNRDVGVSQLTRSPDDIQVTLFAKELEPRSVATMFIRVFNEPGECDTEPCTESDLSNPDVEGDVLFGDSVIVDQTRQSFFTAVRNVDDHESSTQRAQGRTSFGLTNPEGAEIHLIVRDHGRVIPSMQEDMLNTWAGGCRGFPDTLGRPGPNECRDALLSIHLSP